MFAVYGPKCPLLHLPDIHPAAHVGTIPVCLQTNGADTVNCQFLITIFGVPCYPDRAHDITIVRTIAYRLQELAYGGLSKATRRKLIALTKELQTNGGIAPDPGPRVRPGARLVREWRGRTHTVVVTEDGFEYAGKTYSSLSKIAQAITGAHWSGPRFFGLNRSEVGGGQSELSTREAIGEGEHING